MAKEKIKYQGISALEVLAEARNYNQWIADEIRKYIREPKLEIGAGTGNLSNYFLSNKGNFYITEKDDGLLQLMKKRFKNYKNISLHKLDITSNIPSKFRNFFSSIYCINVLEHIRDDEFALSNMNTMLRKNGRLILLVPAKKIAYMNLDKELGHFRRYEKAELMDKLINNGYKVEKIYFFNIVGLLSWYVRGKVKKKNYNLKPYHIYIFDSIVPFLRIVESMIKPPLGISLIVVAKKI